MILPLSIKAFGLFIFANAASSSSPFDLPSQGCRSESSIESAETSCAENKSGGDVARAGNTGQIPLVDVLQIDDDLLDPVPWSHEPVCTHHIHGLDSELCVYTIKDFDRGRGVSLFTTPRVAEEFASMIPFRDVVGLGVNDHTDVWYTKALPGKGIAMLAKNQINGSNLISAYTPALFVYMDPQLSTLQREKYLRIAVDQLPAPTRDAYLSLTKFYNNPLVEMQDILKSNTFEMDLGGIMHLALIPEPSRMNHDCAPKYYLQAI
jgi:hypothetical protein